MTAKRNYTPLDADELVDPDYLGTGAGGGKYLKDDQTWDTPAGGSGAPDSADYLVGTANAGLSAEIVVGTSPGGELGGTWASPTVDATHAGSTHLALGTTPATQAFGDAAAGGSATTASKNDHKHAMPADPVTAHAAASDPHTGYRLESAAILPADLDVSADNTTADATTGHHGLLPKLGGGATNFLRADGSWAAPSGSGAPASVDYLVGTADGGLSAEIVVGTTPGGELGGTWASPTVDATHAGSTHVALGSTPSTQAFGDSASGGSDSTASKNDHKHAMPANPIPGRQVVVAALGYAGPVATNNTTPAASGAYLHPIQINAPMLLRSLDVHMQAASSGTWQWGLFDPSSSATSATKLAGGSGTLNGTGIQVIAASGAPVTVPPGGYFLIVHAPAANQGSVYRVATIATVLAKSQASYVWDDTPDLTTGWGTTTNFYQWFLHGDVDGSNQW